MQLVLLIPQPDKRLELLQHAQNVSLQRRSPSQCAWGVPTQVGEWPGAKAACDGVRSGGRGSDRVLQPADCLDLLQHAQT
jgi:hypothetical protein